MNVYKINKYHIAAENADVAFQYFIDKTTVLDDTYYGQMDEGEEDQFIINIKRLTSKEMNSKFITCCWDGCELCEGKDEPVLFSPNEIINEKINFPCIICREE